MGRAEARGSGPVGEGNEPAGGNFPLKNSTPRRITPRKTTVYTQLKA